jgi:hypothetical protein
VIDVLVAGGINAVVFFAGYWLGRRRGERYGREAAIAELVVVVRGTDDN